MPEPDSRPSKSARPRSRPSHQLGKFDSDANRLYLVAAERAPIASRTTTVHPAKTAPYECGIVPESEPGERFPQWRGVLFVQALVELLALGGDFGRNEEVGGHGVPRVPRR